MKSTEHRRTRHFNIMLAVLAAAALIAALIAIDPTAWASRGSRHGWVAHHGQQDTGMAFCAGRHEDGLEHMGAYLKTWLDLDSPQEESWTQVEQGLAAGLASLRDACGGLAAADVSASMPERLAAMESVMAAGTEALGAIRPAFDAFYGTLDENQRRKLDELPRHHRSAVR